MAARRLHGWFVIALALAIGFASAPAALAAQATISGRVVCRGGADVVGVWVAYRSGGGTWAKRTVTSARWVDRYAATITVPSEVQLHVGCGGDEGRWGSNNQTSFRAISRAGTYSATCKEAAGSPAVRCGWWTETILVGAPFEGVVNRFGYADVMPGKHPIYGDRNWSDWSTDFYAAATTTVRPRIYPPSATGYELRVDRVVPGCAGKVVAVGVYRAGVKVGEVSYAHLASVPAFAPGQVITTGTGLGRLKLWPKCAAWQVTGASGVHTHIEVGTHPGTACFRPGMSKKAFPDSRLLGIIAPGKSANCA